MAKSVVGLYDDLSTAHEVIRDLDDHGFDRHNVSLIVSDPEGEYSDYVDEDYTADDTSSVAVDGAGIGAVLGGLAGLVVGMGAITLPVLGPVIAAGPIVSTLVGMGVGAATGGILGALVDVGVPEAEAEYYAEGIRRGGVLVVLETDEGRAQEAAAVMERHNPIDVEQRAARWREEGWSGFSEG